MRVNQRAAIDIVTLDRPRVRNALDAQLIGQLTRYFEALPERLTTRVVLLRAEGPDFCSGVDFGFLQGTPGEINALLGRQRQVSRLIRLMRACPQPIIALVHGAACGAGFSLALASDVRFAARGARMNAAYIRIGLSGCDLGCSYFLPRLIGSSVASELILTGRFISAEQAKTCGLVSEVVEHSELEAAGLALAEEMLLTAPLGLRLSKEALNINLDAPGLEAALALEDRQQILLCATADHREAVSSFREKRPASFRDL